MFPCISDSLFLLMTTPKLSQSLKQHYPIIWAIKPDSYKEIYYGNVS